MSDFDFDFDLSDFDFEQEFKFINLPVCALVEKAKSKKKICQNIKNETKQLEYLINNFDKDVVYKFISVKGGFSSINFIDYISKNETIEDLFVCSLAVGKKHIQFLDKLKSEAKLKNASFIIGVIFEKRGLDKKYDYFNEFIKICKKNNWQYISTNNHAKLILMRTEQNYYVLETSGNLNENPKIEQFSFEESKELYNFYYEFIKEVLKC